MPPGSPFAAGGDPPRWRASALLSLSSASGVADVAFLGRSAAYTAASARYDDIVDGVYLSSSAPGREPLRVLATGDAAAPVDVEAPTDAVVTALQLSGEALRGDWLAVQMTTSSADGSEVASGVYTARLDRSHAFSATFREPRGSPWWVEVGVSTTGPLRGVEARVDDGGWLSLDLLALFTHAKGNESWVEVTVRATAPLAGVDARADFGAWQPLASTPWGTWGAVVYVPDGSQVDFRARSPDDDVVTAGGYRWPR